MKCNHCGAEIPDDSFYCENCGKKLVEEEKSTSSKKFIWLGISILLIGAVVLFVVLSNNGSYSGDDDDYDDDNTKNNYSTEQTYSYDDDESNYYQSDYPDEDIYMDHYAARAAEWADTVAYWEEQVQEEAVDVSDDYDYY